MILDTDILSAIVSPNCPERVAHELENAQGPICTTAVNWAEISYGLARHPAGERLRKRYEKSILPVLQVLDFDFECAEIYGVLRAGLEAEGRRLAEADLMIAAVALRHGLSLVTGNERHFRRVPGLEVVNWLA